MTDLGNSTSQLEVKDLAQTDTPDAVSDHVTSEAPSDPNSHPNSESKPTRKTKLSTKGLENKIAELSLGLRRKINSHFKELKSIQQKGLRELELSEIIALVTRTESQANDISSLFNELCLLCNNKVDELIMKTHGNYEATITPFINSMKQQIEEAEEIELQKMEESIQQNNLELEEEDRLFEQLMAELTANPLQIRLAGPKAQQLPTEPQLDGNDQLSSSKTTVTANPPEAHPGITTIDLRSATSKSQNSNPPVSVCGSTSKSSTEDQKVKGEPTTESQTLHLLVQGLAAAIDSRRSVEPTIFNGNNILEFADWEVDLDVYLRNERIEGADRLRHLKKYVAGEARTCIEGHLAINTNQAYQAARALLKERYGNERVIVRNFRTKLDNWPRIMTKDAKGLRQYSDFLGHLESAMCSFTTLAILNDYVENEKMVRKLPDWMKIKWTRIVGEAEARGDDYPSFQEYARFIKQEAHVMNLPIAQALDDPKPKVNLRLNAKEQPHYNQPKQWKSFQTLANTQDRTCVFCGLANHPTADCYRLQEKSKHEKDEFLMQNGLCYKCIDKGHRAASCGTRVKCAICRKSHATANHERGWNKGRLTGKYDKMGGVTHGKQQAYQDNRAKEEDIQRNQKETSEHSSPKQANKDKSCHATGMKSSLTTMAIPVYVSAGTGRELLVYALLDNQSDACYITSDVLASLKPKEGTIEKAVTIHTINGSRTEDVIRYDNLTLRGFMTNSSAQINAYETKSIYCDRTQLPTPAKARKLEHLQSIADSMPECMDIPIGLLLGIDVPEILQPLEILPASKGKTGEAFGVRTLFGWTMCGGTVGARTQRGVYKINTKQDKQLLEILEQDFKDIGRDNNQYSQEDLQFLNILENSSRQNEQGNYVMPLPFKATISDLPNNKVQAERRLVPLITKFKRDPSYYQEYKKFMDELFAAGHADRVTGNPEPGKVWYIPHFSVRHKQKGKLRVVFDASAKFDGVALNDSLLGGPDHINSLIGILLRFRKEPIAITCDIQQMFYNFLVLPEQRDYLRFLWVDEDLTTIVEYHMNVHLFGAKSSPGVATFGLRKLARDQQETAPEAAKFLIEDFYVDDGVTSVATTQEAIKLIEQAVTVCKKGNIRLHKFQSNNKAVLASIPVEERGISTQTIDIFQDQLPIERTLGMEWCLANDTFKYSMPKEIDKPATKRGLLSTIAQVYDPLGLIAPFILKGKRILQEVVAQEESWDQIISESIKVEWEAWLANLQDLVKLEIPRCIKPEELGDTVLTQLHHFSDACQKGYGACSYVRQIAKDGTIHCYLILAKARVTPLRKATTIPRLELQGAVTATRLAATLHQELKLTINAEYFWTDSKVVLGYIGNDTRRFHTFVANRINEIKQGSQVSQWNYVSSADNPADIVSRGATANELRSNQMWLEGPHFLRGNCLEDYLSTTNFKMELTDNDPEVRQIVKSTMSAKVLKTDHIAERFTKFSDWSKLVRGAAVIRSRQRGKLGQLNKVTTLDLEEAEQQIIKLSQKQNYPEMEKHKALKNLNPVLHCKGTVHVGGRVNRTAQHSPIIIPKDSHIAYLITKHIHEKHHHLGRRSTLAAIRDAGYWIVGSSGLVRKVINQCVDCRRLRGQMETQLMGNLPSERLEETPPFTHVGMDIFGPFYVKEKRSEVKRWGLLITCLYSRGIHIETLEEMTTDNLILAIRCFMAQRGPVRTIYCDNGTNLVGMYNELTKLSEAAEISFKEFMLQNRIEFKFNSPHASHQGGVTERLIRSVRAVLNGMSLKHKHVLDSKTLRTWLLEAANIVNSRPLTTTSISDPEDHIVTPNQLLTLKVTPLTAPPPGEFPQEDLYGRKRWKVAQLMADEFWRAWKAEYYVTLMTRQKWMSVKQNVRVGDVVLVEDPAMHRNQWKIGRVTEALAGEDGLVRNLVIKLGNRYLNQEGQPTATTAYVKRPIQKIVVLFSAKPSICPS